MMITEITIKDIPVQFHAVEAPITMIADVPDIPEPEKLYFRVCNGPYLWPEIEQDRLVWRIAQHERRLWQSGESVVFGHQSDPSTEISLSSDQRSALQNYFL
jgi:hypothetical protein